MIARLPNADCEKGLRTSNAGEPYPGNAGVNSILHLAVGRKQCLAVAAGIASAAHGEVLESRALLVMPVLVASTAPTLRLTQRQGNVSGKHLRCGLWGSRRYIAVFEKGREMP